MYHPITSCHHPIVKIIFTVASLLWKKFPSGVILEGLDSASIGDGGNVVVIIISVLLLQDADPVYGDLIIL